MIWVLGEQRGGALSPVTYEALGAGRQLSDSLNAALSLILLGQDLGGLTGGPLRKADMVYLLEHRLLARYTNDGYRKALMRFLKNKRLFAFIIPGTSTGRDLAPVLAGSLGIGCVTNASGLGIKNDTVYVRRPLYGGKIIETLSLRESAIISITPRAFKEAQDKEREGDLIKAEADLKEDDLRVKVKERVSEIEKRDITEAEVLVSGGRGVGGAEGFNILEELASALGGLTAASRAAVDAGWVSHSLQVGQTGRVVSPKLYIACGISGAPQHIAGMRTSQYVMAINKDPNAPIFRDSDLGITGDLFDVVPELIREIRNIKDMGARL